MQTAEEIYQQYVNALPNSEKLRLIAKVSNDLIKTQNEKPKRSLLELEGLGKEFWQEVNTQKYINELRKK